MRLLKASVGAGRAVCGWAILLGFSAAVMSAPAGGQVLYGAMVGSVTDATHAAVPGATIRVIEQGTNVSRDTVSNESGYFAFNTLLPGRYSLTVSREGFKEAIKHDIDVSQNDSIRVDLSLEVGAVTEKVEVSVRSLNLQTESA
jgi:hypothetical protein